MTDDIAAIAATWGKRLDLHCPYDEMTLRESPVSGKAICPCCWTYFAIPKQYLEQSHG